MTYYKLVGTRLTYYLIERGVYWPMTQVEAKRALAEHQDFVRRGGARPGDGEE